MLRKCFLAIIGRFSIIALLLLLGGCGLSQTVNDGSVSVTKSLFYKKIKELHLDFQAKEAININGQKAPLATVVRVYQLKDRKTFDTADYQTLLRQADRVLKADLLVQQDIEVMPNGAVTLDMPLDEEAKFVAIVGLFRAPDIQNDNWRLVLSRQELHPKKARTIEIVDKQLMLLPMGK